MRPHLTIRTLWIASVAGALFLGANLAEKPSARRHDQAGTVASAPAQGKADRTMRRHGDELTLDHAAGQHDVRQTVVQAQGQLHGPSRLGPIDLWSALQASRHLATLTDAEIPEALAELEHLTPEWRERKTLSAVLLSRWAEKDGPAAIAYADEKFGSRLRVDSDVHQAVLETWARSDPEAAWRWFQNQSWDGGSNLAGSKVLNALLSGAAFRDPEGAQRRLAELHGTLHDDGLQALAAATPEASRERLLQDTAALPSLMDRANLRIGALSEWALNDTEAALQWIRSLPEEEQKPLRNWTAERLESSKPEMSAALLLENKQGRERAAAYERIISRWVEDDPRAAGEWLNRQPPEPEADDAFSRYAYSVMSKDPAAALEWARNIQRDDKRVETMSNVYGYWHGRNAPDADAALHASGLAEEAIQKIRAGAN